MANEIISLIVSCQLNQLNQTLALQVVRVDTGEQIHLHEGVFLLRIFSDDTTTQTRCLIRHLASGREAFVQGSPNLSDFVQKALLDDHDLQPVKTEPEQSIPPGSNKP